MSRSPAISSTLLIIALCIVIEVSSAPREERILDLSSQEKFLQTREAELLEFTRNARDVKSHESREHEISRREESIPEPPPKPEKKSDEETATKKSTKIDKPNDDSTSKAEVSEAKDMTQSHVSPKDDDDSATATAPSKVPEANEKNSSSDKLLTNKTATDLPPVAPEGDKVTISNASDVASEGKLNSTSVETSESTNATTASVTSSATTPTSTVVTSAPSVTSSTTPTAITNPTTVSSTTTTTTTTTEKPIVTTKETTTSTSTSAPTAATTPSTTATEKPVTMTISISTNSEPITDNPMTITSTEMSEAERLLHSKPAPSTSMPSGIVALITAIAFAILAVIAYIGLVVWRRYLEWRYGNRELLVNEFDSNDIGNFEL